MDVDAAEVVVAVNLLVTIFGIWLYLTPFNVGKFYGRILKTLKECYC